MVCREYEWEVGEVLELVKFVHDSHGEEDLAFTSGMLQCLKTCQPAAECDIITKLLQVETAPWKLREMLESGTQGITGTKALQLMNFVKKKTRETSRQITKLHPLKCT